MGSGVHPSPEPPGRRSPPVVGSVLRVGEIEALQQGMTAARDVSSALARGGDDAEEIKPVGRLVPLG